MNNQLPEQLPPKPTTGVIWPAKGCDIDFQTRCALQAAGLDRGHPLQWVAEAGKVTITVAKDIG